MFDFRIFPSRGGSIERSPTESIHGHPLGSLSNNFFLCPSNIRIFYLSCSPPPMSPQYVQTVVASPTSRFLKSFPVPHGMCCGKQKVGKGGVSEIFFEDKKCSKSLFWKSRKFSEHQIKPFLRPNFKYKVFRSDSPRLRVKG